LTFVSNCHFRSHTMVSSTRVCSDMTGCALLLPRKIMYNLQCGTHNITPLDCWGDYCECELQDGRHVHHDNLYSKTPTPTQFLPEFIGVRSSLRRQGIGHELLQVSEQYTRFACSLFRYLSKRFDRTAQKSSGLPSTSCAKTWTPPASTPKPALKSCELTVATT